MTDQISLGYGIVGKNPSPPVTQITYGLVSVTLNSCATWGERLPEVRCPYCREIMRAGEDGDWFLCSTCDHVTIAGFPSYLCTCQQCDQLRPPPAFVF